MIIPIKVKILEYKYPENSKIRYMLYVQRTCPTDGYVTDWIYVTEFEYENLALDAANALLIEQPVVEIIRETY